VAELGAERRVSVSFSLTDREAFLAKVADAPITTGLYCVFLVASLVRLVSHPDPGPALYLFVMSAGWAAWMTFKGRQISGQAVVSPLMVTVDGAGLTYGIPGDSVTLPWGVWGKASRRFGIWTVRLAAQGTAKISIPVAALGAEQDAALQAMFAERGLIKPSRG
jgi:hypothetical protein